MAPHLHVRAVQLVLGFVAIWTATMLFLYWRAHG
jgi:hypothetical protein